MSAGQVRHECPECGHITQFGFVLAPGVTSAPSWTCKCGHHVQLDPLEDAVTRAAGYSKETQ